MELIIAGSSSSGNCYIFNGGDEALILECGVKFSEVKEILNFNINKIQGVIISHEHMDHAKYAKEYIKSFFPVYCSQSAQENLNIKCNRLEHFQLVTIGNFRIYPFLVEHDAPETLGFIISHREIGNVLFATDTYYLKYKFNNIKTMLIEANYDHDTLMKLDEVKRNRVLKSHMSYDTCCEIVKEHSPENVVLIHLSDRNSISEKFKNGLSEYNVFIADKGLKINL